MVLAVCNDAKLKCSERWEVQFDKPLWGKYRSFLEYQHYSKYEKGNKYIK